MEALRCQRCNCINIYYAMIVSDPQVISGKLVVEHYQRRCPCYFGCVAKFSMFHVSHEYNLHLNWRSINTLTVNKFYTGFYVFKITIGFVIKRIHYNNGLFQSLSHIRHHWNISSRLLSSGFS